MKAFPYFISQLNIRSASEAEYVALNALQNDVRAERLPDDPPIPVDMTTNRYQTTPEFIAISAWAVWLPDKSAMVGYGEVMFSLTGDNAHLGQFDISVRPAYRGQGIGKVLLHEIAAETRKQGRTLLIAITTGAVPAGERFMERLGAEQGLAAHTNQLAIATLNRALIAEWLAIGNQAGARYELGFWPGAYPEADLDAIAHLHEAMHAAPTGDLDIDDFHFTPEHLRQLEENIFARGTERWTMYLREKATAAFVGYTEVLWNARNPTILQQGDTAVFPDHRGQGLGRWLKAAMLDKVLREWDTVQVVRTGNADSNAAMLKINQEMGFKPYLSECVWQVSLRNVWTYLDKEG